MKEKIINAIFTEYGDAIKAYQAAYNKADAEEKATSNYSRRATRRRK